jgi:hypothetical protein
MRAETLIGVCRLILILPVAAWLGACAGEVTPEIMAGVDACNQCNMVIDQVNQACGYVAEGEFVTFDSPVCLLRGLESRRHDGRTFPDAVYVADYGDASFHPADQATFLFTDHVPTVMNGRVLCFASHEGAESQREYPDEVITDWKGFRTARGEPDAVLEIVIGVAGMSPEVVDVAKGDLVLLRARTDGLDEDLALSVTGYPEVEVFTLPVTGEGVEVRLLATRPGAGFPIIDASSGEPLGRLRVSGAHTLDEEAM